MGRRWISKSSLKPFGTKRRYCLMNVQLQQPCDIRHVQTLKAAFFVLIKRLQILDSTVGNQDTKAFKLVGAFYVVVLFQRALHFVSDIIFVYVGKFFAEYYVGQFITTCMQENYRKACQRKYNSILLSLELETTQN